MAAVRERSPNATELQTLTQAQQTGAAWCGNVVTQLEPVGRFVIGGGDPRLYPPHVPRTLSLFEVHFKSRSAVDIRMTRDAFQMLGDFLRGLGSASYRIVDNSVVDNETDGDTYAYVHLGQRTIFVAERFFGVGAAVAHAVTARAQVTVGPRILTEAQKVRVLIHEAAHARLSVRHSGGTAGFDLEACDGGVPSIRRYEQASNNAYCYDLFAYCLSRGR